MAVASRSAVPARGAAPERRGAARAALHWLFVEHQWIGWWVLYAFMVAALFAFLWLVA